MGFMRTAMIVMVMSGGEVDVESMNQVLGRIPMTRRAKRAEQSRAEQKQPYTRQMLKLEFRDQAKKKEATLLLE
jgi:hypothetical protein